MRITVESELVGKTGCLLGSTQITEPVLYHKAGEGTESSMQVTLILKPCYITLTTPKCAWSASPCQPSSRCSPYTQWSLNHFQKLKVQKTSSKASLHGTLSQKVIFTRMQTSNSNCVKNNNHVCPITDTCWKPET